MENNWYSLDVSPLWVVVVFLLAAGLATLLYSKPGMPWNRNQAILLGFLRFSALLLILLLILNPLLRQVVNTKQAPILVVALDNSGSIGMRSDAKQQASIKTLISQKLPELEDSYQIEYVDLNLNPLATDSLVFEGNQTDLGNLITETATIYEGLNLVGLLLISDGIFTSGKNPANIDVDFPIFTLGIGDTIAPKDISISGIKNNRIAYQGNDYPVLVDINQNGYAGQAIQLEIKSGNQVLTSTPITLKEPYAQHEFRLNAEKAGLKRLTATFKPLEGESSITNNTRDFYIDIIEGKETILITAPAPHPDIFALRNVLSRASNYETVLYIPGMHDRPTKNQYDVVIQHQAFTQTEVNDWKTSGNWYILGERSNLSLMNREVNYLSITNPNRQTDQVKPVYNNSFTKFKLNSDLLDRADRYPPITVPFGQYELTGPTEILFYQRIGNIVTDRPLIAFFDDGSRKAAITMGTGVWRWRLQEAAIEGESKLFDEWVLKTIQYLSLKTNKKQFIVQPENSSYTEATPVILDTEVYNDIYERSYGNTIKLTVTDENGKSSNSQLTNNPSNNKFELGTLPPGLYQYTASTVVGSKSFTERGEFMVKDINVESIELTANHRLLQELAIGTDGYFAPIQEQDKMLDQLRELDAPVQIQSTETKSPIVQSFWILFLIAGLLSTEWFIRKYQGAY